MFILTFRKANRKCELPFNEKFTLKTAYEVIYRHAVKSSHALFLSLMISMAKVQTVSLSC